MDIVALHSMPVTPDLVCYPIEDHLTPDNVLTYPIGRLTKVALVGLTHAGEPYYASNVDAKETLHALETFVEMLKRNQLERSDD